jgi:hypothetical protein
MSIGMVREDGKMYYAVSAQCNFDKANEWVKKNVIPFIFKDCDVTDVLRSRAQIKKDVILFVGEKPEFWADYCSYDWVVFCQLFGKMIDLPKDYPMYCNDFQQMIHFYGIPKESLNVINNDVKHNALHDAIELKMRYDLVNKMLDNIVKKVKSKD